MVGDSITLVGICELVGIHDVEYMCITKVRRVENMTYTIPMTGIGQVGILLFPSCAHSVYISV